MYMTTKSNTLISLFISKHDKTIIVLFYPLITVNLHKIKLLPPITNSNCLLLVAVVVELLPRKEEPHLHHIVMYLFISPRFLSVMFQF